MNDEAVYRTAPATPGLLIMFTNPQSLIIRPYANNYKLSNTTNNILAAAR